MNLSKLIELHEVVKNHPYRINSEDIYMKSYRDALFSLSHEFSLRVVETIYNDSQNMVHDFNHSILAWTFNTIHQNLHLAHIEKCIGVIHNFIQTNKVEYYYTFYVEENTLGLPHNKKYVWDEKKEKYFLYLTLKEYDNAIDFLTQKIKTADRDLADKYYGLILLWIREQKFHQYGK